MRRALIALPVLLLAGCASDAPALRATALNATIGMDEATLVRVVGVPTRAIETGGHRFLAYNDRRNGVVATYGLYGDAFAGFGPFGFYDDGFLVPVERTCETTYELDAGRVTGWTLRGRACRSEAGGFGVPVLAPGPPVAPAMPADPPAKPAHARS